MNWLSDNSKRRRGAVLGCLLAAAITSSLNINRAECQPAPIAYGGNIWSRPRLSGDWDGIRDDLAKKGIDVDVDAVGVGQEIVSGHDPGASFGGVGDYTLKFDTGKAGLWPGGFLKIHAQNSFGRNAIADSGALVPVNGIALFPDYNDSVFAVPNFTFTQFLSQKFGLYFGKIETLDGGDANEFADYSRNKFLNIGLQFNLTSMRVPASTLGAGIVVLPWQGAVLNFSVLDPNGKETQTGLDDPFNDGVLYSSEGRVAVQPFGLTGHQLAGFTWTNKDNISLDQDPSNLARFLLQERFPRLKNPGPILTEFLQRFFPALLVPVQPLNVARSAWNFYYNFDQYLWSPDGKPDAGIGVFFRFGVSDGLANPIKYHYNLGIGGKGMVRGRPLDSFGIGWSRVEFSDHLAPFLRQRLDLGLNHEDTVEMYYNFGVTKWLNITADLQVVNPGLKKQLNDAGAIESVDRVVVAGVRTYVRF